MEKTNETKDLEEAETLSKSDFSALLCDAMKLALENPDVLKVNMLKSWSKDRQIEFCRHLLGAETMNIKIY